MSRVKATSYVLTTARLSEFQFNIVKLLSIQLAVRAYRFLFELFVP